MFSDINLVNLVNHFNYTQEKEKFLNSLSDEDLLFIRDVIIGQAIKETRLNQNTVITYKNVKQKDAEKAQNIDEVLTHFEGEKNTPTNKIRDFVFS